MKFRVFEANVCFALLCFLILNDLYSFVAHGCTWYTRYSDRVNSSDCDTKHFGFSSSLGKAPLQRSWPSVPCPSWSWLWLALPTRRPCLQRNQCSPRLSTKRIRHGTTSCTANVASHAWSKRDLGTSSTLVSRAHARYALTPMRLQTYEEVTSTKHRLTLNRMKQRPVSRRVHKAFGVPRQEEGTPGTAHIFQVPTSSIAPCQEVL